MEEEKLENILLEKEVVRQSVAAGQITMRWCLRAAYIKVVQDEDRKG